jgi:hypothetical protein
VKSENPHWVFYVSRYTMYIWAFLQEEFEDTKGVIRIQKSKKDGQYSSQSEREHRDK